MNKTLIVGIIVVVILAAAGFFVYKGQQSKKAEEAKMMMDKKAEDNAMMKKETPSPSAMMESLVMMGTNAKLGSYVEGENGMTLYVFDKDTKDTSNCYNQCAVNWPPYLVKGEEPATMPEHLGTTKRTDGSLQYTWNGMPLYYYIGDKVKGDVTGDGVGGTWHIAK
ncbi:MAG TPA: hypothetical protein VG917_03490 [Patescibacteria group bacterium]|nr:hypothetical protein [Patescibacteria group bacterium]